MNLSQSVSVSTATICRDCGTVPVVELNRHRVVGFNIAMIGEMKFTRRCSRHLPRTVNMGIIVVPAAFTILWNVVLIRCGNASLGGIGQTSIDEKGDSCYRDPDEDHQNNRNANVFRLPLGGPRFII